MYPCICDCHNRFISLSVSSEKPIVKFVKDRDISASSSGAKLLVVRDRYMFVFV